MEEDNSQAYHHGGEETVGQATGPWGLYTLEMCHGHGEEMEEQTTTGPRGQYTLERCHGGGEESKEVNNNGFAYFCMACYVESGGELPDKGTSMVRLRKHFDAVGHKGSFDENHSAGVRVHLSWKRETVLVSVGAWNRHKPSTATQTAGTRSTRNKKRKGSATDTRSWPSSPSSARASLSLPSSSPFPTSLMSSPSQSPSSSLELPLTQPQAAAPWGATGPAYGAHGPVAMAGTTPDLVSVLLLQVTQLNAKLERHEQRLIQLEGGGAPLHRTSPYSSGFIGAVGPTVHSPMPASVVDQQGRLNDLAWQSPVSMMTNRHSFVTPHGALAQSRGGDRSNLNVHLELVELNGEVTLLPHTADVEDDGDDGDEEPKPPIFPDKTSLRLVSNWPGGSFDGLELVCASQDRSSVVAAGNRLKGAFPIVLTFTGDEVEELRLIDTRAASSSSSDSSTSNKEVVWRWRYRIAPPVAHNTDKGVKSSARRVDVPSVRVADQEQDEDEEGEEEDEEPSAATTPAASTPQPRRWWLW
jgi:hypothetical protein